MAEGKWKNAKSKLKTLRDEMKDRYDKDFEFIGRDVIKCLEECYKQISEKNEDDLVEWNSYAGGMNIRITSVH
ncbi:unnamed protein product [Sphagnum balticum]